MISLHLVVANADAASQWYRKVFAGNERSRINLPDGRRIHVEVDVGGTTIMLADEFPEHGARAPEPGARPPAVFYLRTDDVDTAWERAVANGAIVVRPVADTFWGEREGQFVDPFGHQWGLTQHTADVSIEEMSRLAAGAFSAEPPPA